MHDNVEKASIPTEAHYVMSTSMQLAMPKNGVGGHY